MAQEDEPVSTADSNEQETAFAESKHLLQMFIADHLHSGDKGMIYKEDQLQSVIDKCREMFKKEPMLLNIKAPVKICGDIHGQFADLKSLFRASGKPPKETFLFLGDYIDRGPHSLECMILLLAYKCRYPGSMFLLRGNHECYNVNRVYGFFDELKRRDLEGLYPELNGLFEWMPICANVGHRILCMHGGISEHMNTLADIKNIPRPLVMRSQNANKLALDLLWADPDPKISGFRKSNRGVSCEFGMDVLDELCRKLKLDLVVRGHQCVRNGFERFEYKNKTRIVTVFSAPQYCGEMDNSGAVMSIRDDMSIRFEVLEPCKDKAYQDKRNKERAKVPISDSFPEIEVEVDFEQMKTNVANIFDMAKTIGKKCTKKIKSKPEARIQPSVPAQTPQPTAQTPPSNPTNPKKSS